MHRPGKLIRVAAIAATALVTGLAGQMPALPAQASPPGETVIVLPGATSAEGIAAGTGTTFYAGDLFGGDIYRGDVNTGDVELFIDAPPGHMAAGLVVDVPHRLLFVAGGFDGTAHVYSTATGAHVATVQLATEFPSIVNDVAVTKDGAWFTDSSQAKLYFVPVSPLGDLGTPRTLLLSGPAANLTGEVNNNGIRATADGHTLVVAHSGDGVLNTVDPVSGASSTISGVTVPNVDGILLEGRTVYAVLNFTNEIVQISLDGRLESGTRVKTITSPAFQIPTTVARFGDRLATVNAKFDTGLPPTADTYEVVVVDR